MGEIVSRIVLNQIVSELFFQSDFGNGVDSEFWVKDGPWWGGEGGKFGSQ